MRRLNRFKCAFISALHERAQLAVQPQLHTTCASYIYSCNSERHSQPGHTKNAHPRTPWSGTRYSHSLWHVRRRAAKPLCKKPQLPRRRLCSPAARIAGRCRRLVARPREQPCPSRHPQAAATAKLFSLFRSCHSKSVCQPPCAGLGKQGRSCAWRGHARKQCAGGRYAPADLKPTCQCTRHNCTSRDICSLSVCAGQPAFNDSRAEIRFARALQGQGRCWELCDGHGASVRR